MTAQESPVLRQTGVATTAAIVGFQQDPALESLLTMLRSRKGVQIIGEFETLREAAVAGLGRTQIPDLVVVLQSYSDEFAQEEVNDLVGLMLCGRVLCCYGPWCISDDRSHAIWPIANRVPANSAEIVIGLELAEIARGAWPLSPLAAGEEVFAHRTRLLPGIESAACANGLVLGFR